MRTTVYVTSTVTALHCWPGAPLGKRDYLRDPHLHNFIVTVWSSVRHDDRDVEFHDLRERLSSLLSDMTYSGSLTPPSFFSLSCEQICKRVLECMPNIFKVRVAEDESCGAEVER